jgi:hypothetical protein
MGNSTLQKEAPEEVPVIDADCSGLSREPVEAAIVDKGGTNGDDFEHFDGSGFGIGEARLGLVEGLPSLAWTNPLSACTEPSLRHSLLLFRGMYQGAAAARANYARVDLRPRDRCKVRLDFTAGDS